jgi:hypothetical protein
MQTLIGNIDLHNTPCVPTHLQESRSPDTSYRVLRRSETKAIMRNERRLSRHLHNDCSSVRVAKEMTS